MDVNIPQPAAAGGAPITLSGVEGTGESMVIVKALSLVLVAASFLCGLVGCMDCEAPSLPITEANVVGTYIPNHSVTETLQVFTDNTWLRTYYYPDGFVATDSGTWELLSYGFLEYGLQLNAMSYRQSEWVERPSFRMRRSIAPDGKEIVLADGYKYIRNDMGRIRFRIQMDYDWLYYERQ